MCPHRGTFGCLIGSSNWYFPSQKTHSLATEDLYSSFCQKQHSEKVLLEMLVIIKDKPRNILIFLNYGVSTKEINWS